MPRWLIQLSVQLLIPARVFISGSWVRTLHWAPCWAWIILKRKKKRERLQVVLSYCRIFFRVGGNDRSVGGTDTSHRKHFLILFIMSTTSNTNLRSLPCWRFSVPGTRWSAQACHLLEFQIKHLTQRRWANGRQWKWITQRRRAGRMDPNRAQTPSITRFRVKGGGQV